MAAAKSNLERFDVVKIYIYGMGALSCVVAIVVLYNYFACMRYNHRWAVDVDDVKNILELENNLPPKQMQQGPTPIENEFEFFRRTVRGIPDLEVEVRPWEPDNIGGILIEEKRYVVRFDKGITRYHLARYIYKIQEVKPFLKVKELDLQKLEAAPADEDAWKAEVQFALRRLKQS